MSAKSVLSDCNLGKSSSESALRVFRGR